MNNQAQKNLHTVSDFTKCCCIVMISHVSGRPNWYSTQAVCNQRVFFLFCFFCFFVFFFKNCYYFSDLETQWPRNPELKSSSSQFTSNYMAPMGPLKIKTGLPTSPICQRALITHGQLTSFPWLVIQCQRLSKCNNCYWHYSLRANLKHYRKDEW